MKSSCSRWALVAVASFLMVAMARSAAAAEWLSVQDASGITWARIKFVNLSSEASTWSVWNCRTAVASDLDWAQTDATANWDGVVPAGATLYVWVYGYLAGEVSIGNSDGDLSAHQGAALLDPNGGAEWVVTVAEDRTVTSVLAPITPYAAPAQTGALPEAPETAQP